MPFKFELSKPLAEYGRALREWSIAEVRPYARQADTDHAPPENWSKILDSCPVPLGRTDKEKLDRIPTFEDGRWTSELVYYENLCYGDLWPLSLLNTNIGHLVVEASGTPEQVERWYRPAAEKGVIWAFALTEPGFGSDTSQVATTARRDGDSWVLNGSKIYASNAAIAEFLTVFATVDKSLGGKGIKSFVVPRDAIGLTITKANEEKMGVRSWLTSSFSLEDCRLPLDHCIGMAVDGSTPAPRSGQGAALRALANNRPNVASMAVGVGQASIDMTTRKLREQGASFAPRRWAAVNDDLDRMNSALDRARRMNFRSQSLVDQGSPSLTASASAKAYAPETVERIIRRCMQLLGPEGTSQELLLEKWYRDVKIIDIFEGTGQIHRLVVARSLLGRLAG
jgi:acyl-CoA dehydrogenase